MQDNKLISFPEWAIARHEATNHFYDEYIPYKFHLQMVVNEIKSFIENHNTLGMISPGTRAKLIDAGWGHDLIEDTRTNYNDIVKVSDIETADIIYALTNEKGRNRGERGNDKYYRGIANTPGAPIVKFCDRIANVRYSIMNDSRMAEMYEKENDHFLERIFLHPDLEPLKIRLDFLFTLKLI